MSSHGSGGGCSAGLGRASAVGMPRNGRSQTVKLLSALGFSPKSASVADFSARSLAALGF
jgi:hypothetical protein